MNPSPSAPPDTPPANPLTPPSGMPDIAPLAQTGAFAFDLFAAAPFGFAAFDSKLRCIHMNPAFPALLSLTEVGLVGCTLREAVPALAPVLEPLLQGVLKSSEPITDFEWALPLPGELRRTFLVNLIPLPLAADGAGILLQNVTARKEAEERDREALRHSEEQTRAIFEQASDAIFISDAQAILRFVNAAACTVLGYTSEEIIGRNILSFLHPEDAAQANRNMGRLTQGEAFFTRRRLRRKNGSYVLLEGSHKQLSDGRILGITRDVTQRAAQEAEIEALNSRLHLAVYESSHRIKNHLQVLASIVDMQLAEGDETVPADAVRRLGVQIRALATIHDILTLETRADGATQQVATENLLVKILSLVQQATGHHRLRYSLADIALPIKMGTSLALLANEVVSNAIKHGRGQIEVRFYTEEGQGYLTVDDDGPGFPPGFDPRTAANTGLELIESLCRTDLHGTVSYANGPEGGAHVSVVFPLPLSA